MITRTVVVPLLTGGALAALVAYVYTRRSRRLEMVHELVMGRDPIGIPTAVSDALDVAREDVNVRSEAEAMAVAGVWSEDSAASPGPPVDELGRRAPEVATSGWNTLSESIFHVDGTSADEIPNEEDDLRVPHATQVRRVQKPVR